MSDILALIDNAIEDHETSFDAMRWTPDPPEPEPDGPDWYDQPRSATAPDSRPPIGTHRGVLRYVGGGDLLRATLTVTRDVLYDWTIDVDAQPAAETFGEQLGIHFIAEDAAWSAHGTAIAISYTRTGPERPAAGHWTTHLVGNGSLVLHHRVDQPPPATPRAWINGVDLGPLVAAGGIELTPWQASAIERLAGLRSGSITIRFDNASALFLPLVNVHPIRDSICAWLHANGIRPGDVPVDEVPVIIGRRIYCRIYRRTRTGDFYVGPGDLHPKDSRISVPMRVAPPPDLDAWLATGSVAPTYRWAVGLMRRRRLHVAYDQRRRARARRRRR